MITECVLLILTFRWLVKRNTVTRQDAWGAPKYRKKSLTLTSWGKWTNSTPYASEEGVAKQMASSSIGGSIISRWSRGASPTADPNSWPQHTDIRVQVQGSMVGCTAPWLHQDIMNPPILLLADLHTNTLLDLYTNKLPVKIFAEC